ncbi:RNA-directed DNA polymerase [Streptomyces rubiginosohelvolus]|uniref:RNA-directed DNA polymerase n=1 Tax=Streptomyces rubiginosohelvolus TaxID=67362 RepID=UPI0038087351
MARLSHHTLSQLDFRQALEEEIEWQPDLIPKQIIDLALADSDLDKFADHLKELTKAGASTPYADLITAIKWRNGRRPVHILPIHERVLYRAVVNLLKEDLPPFDRTTEAYEQFEMGPIADSGAQFVIKTDIANYFSTIDHELISGELLARTGRSEISSFLCDFWRTILNRSVGIPQMSEPSKILSEILVGNLHRRLTRKGYRVWRYADDFRITARSRQESIQALDAIHEESRLMGLSLNDWKTHLLPIERYKQLANEDKEKEDEARASAQRSLMFWNPYEDDSNELEVDEVYVEAAGSLLQEWRDETPDAVIEHSGLLQRHKLIRTSLNVLATFEDAAGLPFLFDILLREPQLTPSVFRYIRSLEAKSPDLAGAACVRILESGILNRWQQLWIAWAVQSADFASNRIVFESAPLRQFLNGLLGDRSEMVRGQACLSLAANSSLSKAQWAGVHESSNSLSAPYSAAALAGVLDINDSERQQLRPPSKLNGLAADWGTTCILLK